MMGRRALICGVNGQDGAYLAQLLIGKGYAVFGTSRDAQTSSFGNLRTLGIAHAVEKLSMAPGDFRSVAQVIRRSEPDEIYYLAGQSSVGLSFDQPVETLESITVGTLNVLEAIQFVKPDARLYHASSSECFGDAGRVAADETFPFRPRSPYGIAKASAHWLVANYRERFDLFACNGILFNHESPLRPSRFVTRKIVDSACAIARGDRNRVALGNLEIYRDWGWAPEYVEAMWEMLQTERPDDYVIATGETHSLAEFAAAAFAAVGLDWRDHVVSDAALFRRTEIPWNQGNPAKAESQLGWRAKLRIQEIVSGMIAFCRETGGA